MDTVLKNWIFPLSAIAVCSIFFATGVEASADTYLGCYDESGDEQGFAPETMTTWSNLTSDGCRKRCRKDLYSFAGILGGTYCYCADQLKADQVPKVNDSLCHVPCPGQPAEFCGGSSDSAMLSVYSVCSRGLYGHNCSISCNCRMNRRCPVKGRCPNDECADGWKLKGISNNVSCSADVDECATECNTTNSVNCHNCSALHQRCKNHHGGFACGCEKGYSKASGGICADINECKRNNHNCSQNCTNTEGSYTCFCRPGYELDGIFDCRDIDECTRRTHNCSQFCNNAEGSFYCSCHSGYELDGQFNCKDIDECTQTTHGCSQFCNNAIGSYHCSCSSGYELQGRFNCTDINECVKNTSGCEQRCHNIDGNFTCGCNDGFKQSATSRLKCDDIDECAEHTFNCEHNCTNAIGGYNCSCIAGYELANNGFSCKDIDECERKTSKCKQKCVNNDGSYRCECNDGFRINTTDRFKCDDIDECAERSSNCGHNCTNTVGNYSCSCNTGYELDNDRHKCNDIDECERKTSRCEQNCVNDVGNYSCECDGGFRINTTNRFKCDDIDECTEKSSNCNQSCHNTVGNYSCSCITGYELDSDRHKCNDIDECERKTSICEQKCENSVGNYNCECNHGFRINTTNRFKCDDIDECTESSSNCGQNCHNTVGNYSCSCITGYELDSDRHMCNDVDECLVHKERCAHYCNNTVGSFACSCKPGYRIAERIGESYNCTEIDECAEGISNCEHNCNNTDGSYNCSCNSGYRLDNDSHKCNDVDECIEEISGCKHKCNNTVGGYNCSCNSGYYLLGDGHQCEDVDECSFPSHGCKQNCLNHNGSYSCFCDSGHYKVGDFDCKKDPTGMILGVVITLLIISIVIVVLILLKTKRMFPFDNSKFSKSEQVTAANGNGTRDQMELTKTPTKEAAVKKPKKTCIVVKDLKKYIEKIRKSSGFEEEFRSIPMVSDLSYEFAQSQPLKSKNRFKNILPYDDNRVMLDEVNNDPLTTYINASIIKGYSLQDKIIASHGPTPNTEIDFWRMIWQYDVSVIVMVTKCMEDSKRKCEQYWPLEGSMESDEITISMVSTDNFPDYIITYLKVTKESTSRQLVHLLFTAWPDHGAPDHATSLLSFRRAARNVIDADKYFLVHCSAGVGRTGTFLAIDFLLQQAKDKGSIDVYKYLEGLRDQRMHAVQTLDQYEFIHLALLEAITLGETVASCSALSEHCKHLRNLNPLSGKSYIQTEFDMLQEMHPPLSDEATTAALEKENVSRNRNPKLLPGDLNRVFLRDMETESNYINAVYVSSYRLKDAFISTELPLSETLNYFWAMVADCKCKLVAFLDISAASDDLNNHLLVPVKTKLSVGRHKVWTHSFEPEKLSDHCSSYLVAVAKSPDDDEDIYANAEEIPAFKILVLHFQLSGQLAKLLPKVNEQIKTSSKNIKNNGPVVIVSSDGVNPTGQFIAVSNLIEMATSQHEVDVFNAVHNIKKTQPYFITSLGEYQMIFDALEAEGDTSTYANI